MVPNRLLLTAEADGAATDGGGTPAQPPTAPADGAPAPAAAPPWYAPAESLKTSDPDTWKTFESGVKSGNHKDFPTLVKHVVGLEKKLGTVITPPDKTKPDELKTFKEKLVKAGLDLKSLASEAPESADKYEVKLDAIPESMRSSDLIGEFRKIAHEEGLSQNTVDRLTDLYGKMFTGTVEPALKYTYEQGEKAITDYAREIGKEPEVVKAYGGAWLAKHFSEQEIAELERTGAANAPVLLKYAARAGLDTGEDISVIEGRQGAADNEYETMMANLADKNHPDYKLFMGEGMNPQDPKRLEFLKRREQILMRKFGTGEPPAG